MHCPANTIQIRSKSLIVDLVPDATGYSTVMMTFVEVVSSEWAASVDVTVNV
jgi:hypothetical protein